MDIDDLNEVVLLEIYRQCEAIRVRGKPAAWRSWEVNRDMDDREYGPRYSPAWFGDGTEAARVRLLRTVYRLHAAGLVKAVKSEGGRLERVKITAKGAKVVAELTKAKAKKKPKASKPRRAAQSADAKLIAECGAAIAEAESLVDPPEAEPAAE